jgi:hypothetical protein
MRRALIAALAGILAPLCPGSLAAAQTQPPAPPAPPEAAAAPSLPLQMAAPLPPERLDQLTAPIALYPDPLLDQILMAATYPLEVVEADRWLQQGDNAVLKGDQLAAALAQQRWDPSVKSLVAFPQILRMMDGKLTWTEELGDAFLAGQAAVMDSVQRLRQTAIASGWLRSTPQEAVSNDGAVIVIEAPQPDIVHVPVYDPNVVYGRWSYPDYPPDYFPGYFPSVAGEPLGFDWLDVAIVAPLWRWARSDWHHHRIDVDPDRFNVLNNHWPVITSRTWQHDAARRDRFERAARASPARPAVNAARPMAAVVGTPPMLRTQYAPAVVTAPPSAPMIAHAPAAAGPVVLRPPVRMVVVQSFGQRPVPRPEFQRGPVSRVAMAPPRVAMPMPAPRAAVPVARSAPVPRGGGEHR